jgi:hypothetical protein
VIRKQAWYLHQNLLDNNILLLPQERNTLHMSSLREKVKTPQTLNLIQPLALINTSQTSHQNTHISSLSMYITTHITHPLRTVLQQLTQEILITAFSGGINDNSGFSGGKLDLSENVVGVAGEETCRRGGNVVEFCVCRGKLDGFCRDVDADGVFEEGG